MDKLQQFMEEKDKYPPALGEIVELLVNARKDYTVLTSQLTSKAVLAMTELGLDDQVVTAIVSKFMENKSIMDDNVNQAFEYLIVNQG